MPLLLAGFAALFYGIADFSGGFAAGRSRVLPVLLLSQMLGVVIALAGLALVRQGQPFPGDLMWGSVAGIAAAMGLFMLYAGISRSIVAIVSPASAMVGALLPIIFGLVLGERPSRFALTGAALCLPAILLLTWEGGPGERGRKAVRTALAYGVLAGLGFGGFFVALSRTRPAAGLWPLVASRVASSIACVIALACSRQSFRVTRNALAPALTAGITDMGGNILFLLACQSGLLSLVAVITSLFPAPTVFLGRIFLHQRLSPRRWAGLALALAGVGLISIR